MSPRVRIPAFVLLVVAVCGAALQGYADDQRIEQLQFRTVSEGKEQVIVLSWRTNFAADAGEAEAVATDKDGNTTTVKKENIPVKPEIGAGRSRFTARIPYTSAAIKESVSLDVTVRSTLTGGATVSDSLSIDMQPVRDYFSSLAEIDRLRGEIGNYVPRPLPPDLKAEVISVSDRSITVRAKSNQFVRVQAFAYPTTDPKAATGNSQFKSDEEVLFDNRARDMTIRNLSEKTNYIIVLREVSPTADRSPATATLVDYNSAALRTIDPLPRPTLSFVGVPASRRNEQIAISLNATNVSKLRASVYRQAGLDETEVASNIEVPIAKSNDTVSVLLPLPVKLREGEKYFIRARGLSADPSIEATAPLQSKEFDGLKEKLFETISIAPAANAVRFVPVGASEPIIMNVVTEIGDATNLLKCSDPAKCEILTSTLLGLVTKKDVPQLVFRVTAESKDGSMRTQSATYAFTLAPAPSETKEQVKTAAKSFIAGLTGGNENSAIKAKNVKGGIGTIFAVLLKAYLGI